MIYPDFLKQGSCIGVPAPSSGAYNNLYNNRYNNAKKKLEERGYKVVLSKNIFNSYNPSIFCFYLDVLISLVL